MPDTETLIKQAILAVSGHVTGEGIRIDITVLESLLREAYLTPTVGVEMEWAVQYKTKRGDIGYNRFPDQKACERFIESPSIWFDPSWTTNVGIATRMSASPWELLPENKNLTPKEQI